MENAREELQVLCGTLESQKRSLEEELLQLRGGSEVEISEVVSEKIETLEQEKSKLLDDLFREKDDHSRVEAELQEERSRLMELQEQLSLLKAEYEDKFQTVDSHEAWVARVLWRG